MPLAAGLMIIRKDEKGTAMDNQAGKPGGIILVEFEETGLISVSTETELAEKSVRAINKAMETIREMAQRVADTVQNLPGKPQTVEVDFGLKLSAEAGALIAKTGVGANINVKLTWKST